MGIWVYGYMGIWVFIYIYIYGWACVTYRQGIPPRKARARGSEAALPKGARVPTASRRRRPRRVIVIIITTAIYYYPSLL